MTDALEEMLKSAIQAIERGDRSLITGTRRMDDTLDKLNMAIKEYLARLDSDSMNEADSRRFMQILKFITNLEHAGDVLDRNVMMLTNKSLKRGQMLSNEGRDEIKSMLERLTHECAPQRPHSCQMTCAQRESWPKKKKSSAPGSPGDGDPLRAAPGGPNRLH